MTRQARRHDLQHLGRFDRDRLNMVPRDAAMTKAFEMLNAVQGEKMELQVAAVSALFAAYTSRLRLDPYGAFHLGQKIQRPERFHREANNQQDALEDFIGLRAQGVI